MTSLVTRDQMREIEAAAFAAGATEDELGDRAAEAIAAIIRSSVPEGAVVIIAGPGNNGLDALKVGRILAAEGRSISERCWRRKDCGDLDLDGLRRDLAEASVVVDGLFGIGLTRAVEGEPAEIIRVVEEERARRGPDAPLTVVAVDLPSGLNSDTGEAMGIALRSDVVVTLGAPKIGLYMRDGPALTGSIQRESIGLNTKELARADAKGFTTDEPIELPTRQAGSHKNDNGRVLVIGGSLRYPGAPVMTAQAAHRVGAGYVTVAFPRSLMGVIGSHLLGETLLPLAEAEVGTIGPSAVKDVLEEVGEYKAVVLGNGLGREDPSVEFVLQLLGKAAGSRRRSVGFRAAGLQSEADAAEERPELPPVVVDGDGLYALSTLEEWWSVAAAVVLVTPHPGEMARLLGCEVEELEADRIGKSREAAAKWGKVVLLKGAHPIVAAPSGEVQVMTEPHPELGTAGSGDVLAGLCGYLVACGNEPAQAARAALVIGARAGALAAEAVGRDAVGPVDLIAALPKARAAQ